MNVLDKTSRGATARPINRVLLRTIGRSCARIDDPPSLLSVAERLHFTLIHARAVGMSLRAADVRGVCLFSRDRHHAMTIPLFERYP